jgi:hypothetical protein
MKSIRPLIGLLGAAVLLSACVETRSPVLVNMVQSKDAAMTCSNIATEYKVNTEVATNKISKNNSDDGRDILLGVLIWPGLADFKNADGNEGNALLDRNIRLREIALEKECDILAYPPQPERYT